MLVNVISPQSPLHRVLVLAPENTGLSDLGQLGDDSDIAALVAAGSMHVDALTGDVSEDEISQALLAGRYDIFHGALHGDPDGIAVSEWISREQLGEILQVHGISLAVLLSCESANVARRVAEAGVCCVVGTNVKITNRAAYAFCLKFYRHLVKDDRPEKAFEYARRLLKPEWREWFSLIRAEDCAATKTTSLEARLTDIEQKVDALTNLCRDVQRSSREGHEQITAATLQLVNLFLGLMGAKK